MIKISIYGNIDKIDYNILEGEYPGDKENLKEAITQLFIGNSGEWLIIGEFTDNHIKVNEFYEIVNDNYFEKSFEELYLNQTGGWFGIDIDKVFMF